MDGQLYCLHCYVHASVSLYFAYAFAGQSIAKNIQRRVIISYYALCKHADGIFSQIFVFYRFTAAFESRVHFLCAKNVLS